MASMCFVHSPYTVPVQDGVPLKTTLVPYQTATVAPVVQKPRDRSTRPTTAARPQGNNNTKKGKRRKEICLDYLKGVCKHNRYQCKYDHQELPSHLRRERVCPVYYFTGHCKFGAKCPNVHPSKEKLRTVCAVTISGAKENPPPSPSVTSSCEDYAQFPLPSPTASDPASDSSSTGKSEVGDSAKRVNALLNKLAPRNFDSIVSQLRGTMHQGVQLEDLIDTLCRRVPSDGEAQAKVLARVLAVLIGESNAKFSLAWTILFACRVQKQVDAGYATKAKNLMTFLGALVCHRVFFREHVEHLQQLLLREVQSQQSEANSDNAVFMLCVFLEYSAPDLVALLGQAAVRKSVADLQKATWKHRACAKVRVMNLDSNLQSLLTQ